MTDPATLTLTERLQSIRQMMADAQAQSPVSARRVTLVGASKTQPAAVIEEAIRLGVTEFGENRIQEAAEKWPALKKAHPHIKLHLIGPLQSNKTAEAVALFDVIETIDRAKIADAILRECNKRGRYPICFVQVNTGEEPQKGGVAPPDLKGLLNHCREIGLKIEGLMCIPPADQNPAPHFALLKKLAGENGLTLLSMGMSEDACAAIRLGATHVRIGTKLFGVRLG